MRIPKLSSSLRARFPRVHRLGAQSARTITSCQQHPSTSHHSTDELFNYTSGRWIYNEQTRLSERYLQFDIPALKNVIAVASGRESPSDIITISKLAEGGFNRILQATFKDGKSVIARLPYPSTEPEHYTVASEAATLDYLRLHGFCTPKVYAWCSTKENPVGAEYIIMEKLDGIPLGETWFSMTPKEQHKVMKQVVEWETRLMSLEFPACGSIYYRDDLPSDKTIPLSGEFCVGPMAHYSWWCGERRTLDIDRGPWSSSVDIFRAVGERELTWTKHHAQPRQPYERLYREIHHFNISPDSHIKALSDYLLLAPYLSFPAETPLDRPTLRHPDLQPNNILISESHEVIGLIDWQHSTILPLGLAAGIPKHFQNYGDPESESLTQPQLDLPSNYTSSLSPPEQTLARQTLHKRLIHFLYAAFTKRLNEDHYNAIFDPSTITRQRLYEKAGTPWEGDSITLRAELIRVIQSWPWLHLTSASASSETPTSPPITYPKQTIHDTLALNAQQEEADAATEQMRRVLGVDVLGWVPHEEYDAAREMAREIKGRMLDAAETDDEGTAVRDHFPFDDFDENA